MTSLLTAFRPHEDRRPRSVAALLAALVVVGSIRANAADPASADEGKRAFKAGVLLLQDPDGAKYDEALIEFRRAYRALGTWKVLGNIGLCALKLERDGEAVEAYEKYLAGGGSEIEKDEREQVERDLLRLRNQLVKVHFEVALPGAQLTDERTTVQASRISNLYPLPGPKVDLGLHPGHHNFVAKLGDKQARWEVDLLPASSVNHRLEFVGAGSASPGAGASNGSMTAAVDTGSAGPTSSLRTIGFVVGGVGVVGLGIGTLFAIKRSNKLSDSEALCNGPGGVCPDSKRTEIDGLDDEARSAGTIAVAGFAVGGAALATGVALIVLGSKSQETVAKSDAPRVTPWIGAGSAGLSGTF